MQLGLALPQFDHSVPGESPLGGETVLRWAREAERLGFSSVWLADHLFLDPALFGGDPGRSTALDPLVTLAAVARATTRVRIGTLVLCAQLRPPAVAAKALATLDVISAGRLDVGVGAGWYRPEYEAAGVPFERHGVRLAQLAHLIDVCKSMFAGRWGDAPCRPAPVQRPRPPVVVGCRGDRALGVVARHADGWNTVWTWTFDAYRERLRALERACEAAGRDPATVSRSVGLHALVGEDERDLRRRFDRMRSLSGLPRGADLDSWRQGRLVGTVAQVREQLAGWAELGVGTVIATLGALPFAVTDGDDLALLAAVLKE